MKLKRRILTKDNQIEIVTITIDDVIEYELKYLKKSLAQNNCIFIYHNLSKKDIKEVETKLNCRYISKNKYGCSFRMNDRLNRLMNILKNEGWNMNDIIKYCWQLPHLNISEINLLVNLAKEYDVYLDELPF